MGIIFDVELMLWMIWCGIDSIGRWLVIFVGNLVLFSGYDLCLSFEGL